MDDLTLDVVCGKACPILPRTTIFTKFQDVGWFEQASEEDIERFTVGLGPYRIVEWRSGLEIELEAYEDYNPNPNTIFSRPPLINTVIQQWRNEPLVRASMLETGEARLGGNFPGRPGPGPQVGLGDQQRGVPLLHRHSA